MEWLNIHSSTIDSPEFVGCEPVDRATWLCLMRYCHGQENGGVISNCKDWGDRRWQQLIRITKLEVQRVCPLWKWSGSDLVVSFYPFDREAEVKAKRLAAEATNAQRSAQRSAQRNGERDAGLPFPFTLPLSPEGGCKGETEIPTAEQAIAMVMTCGIPDGFAKFIYGDWSSRAGKDASGVVVEFVRYAKKRWEREKVEWGNRTHKGNKVDPAKKPKINVI